MSELGTPQIITYDPNETIIAAWQAEVERLRGYAAALEEKNRALSVDYATLSTKLSEERARANRAAANVAVTAKARATAEGEADRRVAEAQRAVVEADRDFKTAAREIDRLTDLLRRERAQGEKLRMDLNELHAQHERLLEEARPYIMRKGRRDRGEL